jgi:hypothetical protein
VEESVAILSFAITKEAFLEGKKTVTRRAWSDTHFRMWVRLWDTHRRIHDAWDNSPRAGGKRIGRLRLTHRPYKEKLARMPATDLKAEGDICSSIEEFCSIIGKTPRDYVTVIRFEKL